MTVKSVCLTTLFLGISILLATMIYHNRELWYTSGNIAYDTLLSEFSQSNEPVARLLSAEVRQLRSEPQLLEPEALLPNVANYSKNDLREILRCSYSCQTNLCRNLDLDDSLKKYYMWTRYLCNMSTLPADFFVLPPYLSPFGESYVAMALGSKRLSDFANKEWLEQNKNYMHILEVVLLEDYNVQLTYAERFLSNLSLAQLADILRQTKLIMTDNHLLRYMPVSDVYSVYSLFEWREFAATKPYDLVAGQAENCLAVSGNACWVKNLVYQERQQSFHYVWMAVALMLILLSGSVYFYWYWREAKIQRDNHLLIMQTLAHELAAPAASLNLSLETMRAKYDGLTDEQQIEILRMTEEVSRMNRLIFTSRSYFKKPQTSGAFVQNKQLLLINDLCEDIVGQYHMHVSYKPLAVDLQVLADGFWLGLCIKNLIKNSLAHGKPPVVVYAAQLAGQIAISVEDQGSLQTELTELVKPFVKHKNSSGMGLGLSIVNKVVNILDGELKLTNNPTCFTIYLYHDQ